MDRRPARTPPPTRHAGSKMIARAPNVVRAIAKIRDEGAVAATKVRREDIAFTEADVAAGVACTSGTFITTHVTMVYRSGHALFTDLALGTGAGSVLEARLTVPDLSLTGVAVQSPSGGTEQDIRITLVIPDAWTAGDAHRVYVEARRVSGSDSTTVRVLRAWQR